MPFSFETPVSYLQPRADEIPDGAFVAAVAEAADCGILLDLHNIWTNERNGRQPARDFLAQIPLDRVSEVHLAGGLERDGFWLDAHSGGLAPELEALAAEVLPQLPELRVVVYEILPEFVVPRGERALRPVLERVHRLVDDARRAPARPTPSTPVRGPVVPATSGPHTVGDDRPAPSPTSAGAPSAVNGRGAVAASERPAAWEHVLASLAIGRSPSAAGTVGLKGSARTEGDRVLALGAELSRDPGVTLLRELVGAGRDGRVASSLPLTVELLLVTIGRSGLEELLARYASATTPALWASAEGTQFAAWARAGAGRPPDRPLRPRARPGRHRADADRASPDRRDRRRPDAAHQCHPHRGVGGRRPDRSLPRHRRLSSALAESIGRPSPNLPGMWLPWPPAIAMSVMLWLTSWLSRRGSRRRLIVVGAFAAETALVLALYALWRVAGTVSVWNVDGALDRGRAIWDLEQAIHLPSELRLQQVFLEHPLWIQAANGYYAVAHVPAIIALLLWAFIRHRDDYPRVRNVLALATGACLLAQLIAVAPPRMYPTLGFVDSGHLYGQSVYTAVGTGVSDQLSAMPSVHVAWAVLVGVAAVVISSSRWRWLVLAHPVLTLVVVAATANHWWLDGVVAVAILGLAALVDDRARSVLASRRRVELPAPPTEPATLVS